MTELLNRLKAFPLVTVEMIVASLFINVLALASPIFVIQVLNRYVAYGVDSTLAALTAGVVLAIVFEFLFRGVRLRMADAVAKTFDRHLSENAFQILLDARLSAMNRVTPGMRREIVNGVTAIQNAAGPTVLANLMDVPLALLFVGALYLLSWQIAVVVCIFIVAVVGYTLWNQGALRQPAARLQGVLSRRNVMLAVAVNAADTVRAFNSKGFMRERWSKDEDLYGAAQHAIADSQGTAQSVTQSTQSLMSAVVIATGALLVVSGEMDVGTMIGANILAARALMPLSRLANMGPMFVKSRQAIQMLREAARMPREKVEGSALKAYKGGIELRDLAFAYPGSSSPLFESLSLRLEPGAVLAVAGGNGTGKTTLACLLVGLMEPGRGQVLADGVDLQQLASEWWRSQVIYMPQEPRFLEGTLRENFLAFNPDLDDAKLQAALTAAGLKVFVDESPDGADMVLRNNGEQLSLGIRRRLALARALVFDGKIAVLDEPTEGVDAEGCKAIYALMNDLRRRGCTIIVFSHDPNIVKGAQILLDLNSKPVPRLLKVGAGEKPESGATPGQETGDTA